MKIRVVALGHRMPAWVAAGFEDYARRLPREFMLELVEIRPEPRDRGKSVAQILAAEARRIVSATKGWRVVALDERGERWNTTRFAEKLRDWTSDGLAVAFVIGSADGLAESIKNDADVVLALSALTLPHGLARVLLAEQIYRAVSVIKGHPYHRE
jgi:23S rRNA (pseudouridine1915-N3)-methyltransferase